MILNIFIADVLFNSMNYQKWGTKVTKCYFWMIYFSLCQFVLHLLWGCISRYIYVHPCYVFLMDRPFYYHRMPFLVLSNNFFILSLFFSEISKLLSLLYGYRLHSTSFSSFYFQPICIFDSRLCLLEEHIVR